jgi:2-polyprenyl-3-methyl-5-hydroxy-6-metoxy-1,4-benzoquinol methylase
MWGPILEHKMPPAVQVNFGLRSDDYARYRPGFPASFYDRLERTFPISDSTGLDLGTGPGTVALELARRGANVLGLDPRTRTGHPREVRGWTG